MKKWIVLSVALAAICLGWTSMGFFRSFLLKDVECIAVDKSVHEFPPTKDHSAKLEHAFKLRNNSLRSVSVVDVAGSCSCASHDLSGKVIPSGSEVILTVRLDAGKIVGRRQTLVRVQFEDKTNLDVKLFAEVWRNAQFLPDRFVFPSNDIAFEVYKDSVPGRPVSLKSCRLADPSEHVGPVELHQEWSELKSDGLNVQWRGKVRLRVPELSSQNPVRLVLEFSDGEKVDRVVRLGTDLL
jgi:hypothetical protein